VVTNHVSQVQDSKTRLEPVVSEWDLDKKKEFFEGFKGALCGML
jgi:hypothetical protein